MKQNLQYTKKKLTIIFTILVFIIALILEGIFFTFKYQNDFRRDKTAFGLTTSWIIDNLNEREMIIPWFDRKGLQRNLFQRWEKPGWQTIAPERFVSFIIINSENELVFENIVQKFDFQNLNIHFEKPFYLTDEVMVRTQKLKGYYKDHHVVFFRKMKYPFSEYGEDLLFFFLITLLCSILFYYAGYWFVSKNLKPVEENIDDMRNFIHNAGHELKTPLAVVHGNMQILAAGKQLDTDLTKESIKEIEKLSGLIDGLVDLSDINKDAVTENLDLSDEIQTIISDFSHEAKGKKLIIDFDSSSKTYLKTNKQYFYILFSNLLGNAIKYSKKWGQIDILLSKDSVSIKDNGKWIHPDQIDKIFDRFYQWSWARGEQWFGIWLSLVKKIADIYKWKLSVESEEKQGSTFTVKF